jgi:hypothetical protein
MTVILTTGEERGVGCALRSSERVADEQVRGLSSKQVAKIIFRGRSPPPTKIESDNGKASEESCPPSVHKGGR